MKNRPNYARNLGLGLLLAFLLPLACKKDKKATPEELTEKTVTIDKSSATPGDVINVKSSFKLDKDSWEILIDTKKVVLSKLTDSTAAFYVPYVASGNTSIDFSSLGVSAKTGLKIDPYTPVSDPVAVKTSFDASLTAGIAGTTNTELAACLNSLKANFNASYDKLSEQEKKEIAFHIQKLLAKEVNSTTIAGKASFAKVSGVEDFAVPTSINSDSEYRQTIIQTGSLLVISGSALHIGANMVAAPTPWTHAAGYASMAFSIYTFTKALACKRLITLYAPDNKTVESAGVTSSSILSLKSGSNVLSQSANTMADITFLKNYTYTFNVSGKFETTSSASKVALVQNFIAVLNSFGATYNKATSLVNSLSSWLSGKPVFPPFDPDIPAKGTEVLKAMLAGSLTIENVSNPAITLTKTGTGDVFALKAQSGTITGQQEFTFDIVYTSILGTSSRKTISAIYDGSIYPEKAALSSGNNQNGEETKKLPAPLVVLVTNNQNEPASNATVEWKIKTGGGTLSAGTSKTNAQGLASVEWTLGATGAQEVEAIVKTKDGNMAAGAPVAFKAFTACQDAQTPELSGVSFRCNASGQVTISIPFKSVGSDILGGTYDVALSFKSPGATNYSISANAYTWRVASGTLRDGIIEINFTGGGQYCISGKSAEETMRYMYANFLWKVEVTNKCGKKSAALSF